jgi:hypothetical protein
MGGYDLEKLFQIHYENTNSLILFVRSLKPLVRAAAEPDQLPKKPSLQSTQQAKLPTPQNTEEPPQLLPDAAGTQSRIPGCLRSAVEYLYGRDPTSPESESDSLECFVGLGVPAYQPRAKAILRAEKRH